LGRGGVIGTKGKRQSNLFALQFALALKNVRQYKRRTREMDSISERRSVLTPDSSCDK
jgi:hypothetical protein